MTDIQTVLSPMQYRLAQSERETAYATYNYASQRLELANIRERNAELCSQSFGSVGKGQLQRILGDITEREREVGLAFARYVARGRIE